MLLNLYMRTMAVALVGSGITGCVAVNHLTGDRTLFETNQKSVAINTLQQILINEKRQIYFSEGKLGTKTEVVCSALSPDVLEAFIVASDSSFSVKPSESKIEFGCGQTLIGAGASIGLRAQTIMILRDELYRICEGYRNGAIDSVQFRMLYSRIQTNKHRLLAIEQVNGADDNSLLVSVSKAEASAVHSLKTGDGSVEAFRIDWDETKSLNRPGFELRPRVRLNPERQFKAGAVQCIIDQ